MCHLIMHLLCCCCCLLLWNGNNQVDDEMRCLLSNLKAMVAAEAAAKLGEQVACSTCNALLCRCSANVDGFVLSAVLVRATRLLCLLL